MPILRSPPLLVATPTPQSLVWRGEYYDNRTLTGPPILIRSDQDVKFDWGYGAPAAIVPADDFSARWTRDLYFPAGAYRFNVTIDNGVRVWIDGDLVIDEWAELPLRTRSINHNFATADTHLIQIDYFEALERAQIDFWWARTSDFPEWRGAYFNNTSLIGDPVLVRNDPAIDFDWGTSSPGEDVAANRFGARWTQSIEFDQGVYRFRARMDDGLRLFIDGTMVINEWREGGLREVVVDYPLNRGFHAIRVEYYDNIGDASAYVGWEKTVPIDEYPDWKAEYWSNPELSGSPALVRNDASINYNWGVGSPPAPIPADNFSARWTRSRDFDSGTYRFHLNVDDGIRMWVDGQLIVDEWQDGSRREITVDHSMASGMHDLRVEFYERVGDAMASLWWEKLQQPDDFPDWKGEYWPNRSLAGVPTVVRNDQFIDFRWQTAAPALGLPADRFSTRWTRSPWFDEGNYRLYARADDGVRVWVDDALVIDRWTVSPGQEVYQADVTLDGQHQIKVEYYDETGLALVEFWWQKLPDQPRATPTYNYEPDPTATLVPPTSTPEASTPESNATPTVEATVEPTIEPTTESTPVPTVEPTTEPATEPTIQPTVPATVTVELTAEPTLEITVEPPITTTLGVTVGVTSGD